VPQEILDKFRAAPADEHLHPHGSRSWPTA
jgi:hypothetical protein